MKRAALYFENLDSLRFFAFLSVFLSHASIFLGFSDKWFQQLKKFLFVHGDLGVNFFFVLSGFLISFLLFEEKRKNGTISLKRFSIRRILRIWPVYYLVLGLGFFVIPRIAGSGILFATEAPLSSLPWYLGFLSNIDLAFFAAPSVILAVLWAISVEQQFYIIWPFVVKKVAVKKIPGLLLAVIFISFVFRYFFANNYGAVKYFTLSVFSDLAVGCLAGYLAFFKNSFKNLFSEMPKLFIGFMYFLLTIFVPLRAFAPTSLSGTTFSFVCAIEPVIFSLFFAFIILEQNYAKNSFFKAGKNRMFSWLGKMSYGLYCYHMISFFVITYIFQKFGANITQPSLLLFIVESATILFFAVMLATLSYNLIEEPFSKLKEKIT